MVIGNIDGICEMDFNRLRGELEECFEKVVWKDGRLSIKSTGEHRDLKRLFQALADCILPGCFGSLLYVGKGTVACFYFGHKKVAAKKFIEPEPPAWWRVKAPADEKMIPAEDFQQ
jgi:hypothetical protein